MNDDAKDTIAAARTARLVVVGAAVIVLGGAGLFVLWGEMATARNGVERVRCEKILKAIFATIEEDLQNPEWQADRDVILSRLMKLASEGGGELLVHSGPNRDALEGIANVRCDKRGV